MIVIEGLSKRFPGRATFAIEDIDLELRDGELLGLVGLNGAGKTTAIRIAVGLSVPTRGSVIVDGFDLSRDKVRASQYIGWAPELFPFDPLAKALDLLTFYAGFSGLERRSGRAQAHELLARVGLESAENQRIRTFSLGMRRRFAIAAMMMGDPHNLLLDEVLSGLDPKGLSFIRNWILDQKHLNKAILLSSHLLSEIEAMADRVALIHEGHLLCMVTRDDLARAAAPLVRLKIRQIDTEGLRFLQGLGSVREEGDVILLADPTLALPDIVSELVRRGYKIDEARAENQSLEAYFLQAIDAAS